MNTLFNVSYEINTFAKNPLEAAKWTQAVVRDKSVNLQLYVQNNKTKEIFSVDLEEEDEDAVLTVDTSEYKSVIETEKLSAYNIFVMIELLRIKGLINHSLEYDTTWEKGTEMYKEFVKSEFNIYTEPIYECIENFIDSLKQK